MDCKTGEIHHFADAGGLKKAMEKLSELEQRQLLELPDDVRAAISALNDLILAMPAISWEPDKFAVDITTLKGEQ